MPDRSHNLWWDTAPPRPKAPPLAGGTRADTVIIGAGIMGAATALRLAETGGGDIAIVEAGAVGDGASSRPGGFVVPHFSVGSPEEVLARVGGETGERLIDATGRSAQHVFDRIQEYGIECGARQGGWVHPAHAASAFDRVRTVAAQWQARGFAAELLDAGATAARTGVAGYAGSWVAPSGGTLHPLRYCQGLADAAVARGCRLYEHSPVTGIERVGAGYRVRTAAGSIAADRVIVCTNGLSADLVPAMTAGIVPLRVRQCATAPLAPEARAHLFQRGECLSDTRRNLFTYRFDAAGRLITGALQAAGISPARAARGMARRLHRLLGLAAVPEITHLWSGTSSVSAARLPASLVIDGGIVSATACNARGIALSTVIGESVADYVTRGVAPPVPVLGSGARAHAGIQRRLSLFYPHMAPLFDWLDTRRSPE